MKKLLALFLLLSSVAHAQNTLPASTAGDMLWRNPSAWATIPGGTAGQFLQSQGPTAQPIWSNSFAGFNLTLPLQATNTVLGNVTGSTASPVPINVNQLLDTIGYDTARPPQPGSILVKEPATGTWQALPVPTPVGWVLTTQGPQLSPQWTPAGVPIVPGAAGTCLVSNGVDATPSYQNCIGSGALSATAPLTFTPGTPGVVALDVNADFTTVANQLSLATAVNPDVGTFGSATQAPQVTVNAKGLVTAATNVTVTPAASSLTGQVALANGGTAANLTASNGGLFYSTATAGAVLAGTATAGQILRSGSSAAPSWSTATYPATAGAANNALASDGTNFLSVPVGQLLPDNYTAYVVSGLIGQPAGTTTEPATGTSLTMTTTAGVMYVSGVRVSVAEFTHAYTASRDTYDFISTAGAVTHSPVPNNDPAPSTPANSVLLQVVVTNASYVRYNLRYARGIASTYEPRGISPFPPVMQGHVVPFLDMDFNWTLDTATFTSDDPTTQPSVSELDGDPQLSLNRIVPGRTPLAGDILGFHTLGGQTIQSGNALGASYAKWHAFIANPGTAGAANVLGGMDLSTAGDPAVAAGQHPRLRIISGVQLIQGGNTFPTGGDKGTGTINTFGVYENGDPVVQIGSVVGSGYAEYTANSDLANIPYDDSIPQVGEGTQVLSVTVTPKSTTNKMRCRAQLNGSNSAIGQLIAAMFVNGGANAVRATAATVSAADYQVTLALEYEYTPGATSAQTVTVRAGGTGVARLNGVSGARTFGGAAGSTLVCEEIKA